MERAYGIENRVRRWLFGRDFALWYDPRYRLPMPSLEARTGLDARRADFAAWFLLERRAVPPSRVRRPMRIGYEDLARVHAPELLESLERPETLARIYSVDPGDVRPEELMTTLRLACGGTLQAARSCLRPSPRSIARRELNLLGGFHHAGRARNGGFCAVNDVAVAVGALRHGGLRWRAPGWRSRRGRGRRCRTTTIRSRDATRASPRSSPRPSWDRPPARTRCCSPSSGSAARGRACSASTARKASSWPWRGTASSA